MALFGWFGTKPAPVASISHDRLGTLNWSDAQNEWLGSAGGLAFSIAYEGTPMPSPELLAYAQRMLLDASPLAGALQAEKAAMRIEFPLNAGEIDRLFYEQVGLSRHKGKNRVFAMLGPDNDERAWRIEFGEDECEGLGFDS